jgi:L-ascorbate metabolism protein UlaG (beta-lactamase superfamily)
MVSVAGLSRMTNTEIEVFFDNTVRSLQAKIVYPIHWDDFFSPLRGAPVLLPRYLDDIRTTFNRIEALCHAHSIQFKLPPFFQPFDPFSDVK